MSRWWATCPICDVTECVDSNSIGEDSEEAFRERHEECAKSPEFRGFDWSK